MARRIKVLISKKKFKGGPRVFRERLSTALSKLEDIKVVENEKDKFDIELMFLRQTTRHNKPRIIRVDGCYYERHRLSQNKQIEESIKRSNCVIFQSQFSKKMCEAFLHIRKPSYVIHNGIDFSSIKDIPAHRDIPPDSFVACAGWRENKRPISTILGFEAARTGKHLFMIGNYKKIYPQYRNRKNIHLVGEKKFEEIISIFKACRYQLHLTHIDSCPNAVVEGLACGLNVLCTNLGGTREIVRDNGIVMEIDNFDFKFCQKIEVDNIKPEIVANYIHKLMKIENRANSQYLDIEHVAKQYADIIRKYT